MHASCAPADRACKVQEAQAPSPSIRTDSSELGAAVGEIAAMAGDSEEGIVLLARKVFVRMFEVSGFRYCLSLSDAPYIACRNRVLTLVR